MNDTCRRMDWPSEATDCSAMRSGSARRMATSVMVEERRRSSSARQASSARNHVTAIGTRTAATVRNVVGLARICRSVPPAESSVENVAQTNPAPMTPQMALA